MVLVDMTAVLGPGVRLSAWQWIAAGALMWAGSAPFAALGTVIGYLTDDCRPTGSPNSAGASRTATPLPGPGC